MNNEQYSIFYHNEVQKAFYLFPLPTLLLPAPCSVLRAPCSLLRAPCSLLPKSQKNVPY
ncbi:hypothetical protein [Moorena producens]|uniref:hypothetical protein n=1 Tax=Moorena producens TaxID=1155739 RepID=UPI000A7E87ED|nr:hypothetical protein [Moorena producens]